MVWWYWIVAGLLLSAAELLTPGAFFFILFGVSAVLVGLVLLIGIAMPVWVQIGLFCVLSLVDLLVFRGPLQRRFSLGSSRGRTNSPDDINGQSAVVMEEIAEGGIGKVELRGSPWSAKSENGRLAVGARCRVVRVEGLTLWVKPE